MLLQVATTHPPQAVPIPRPASPTGELLAVLLPIAGGLLLAAIAAYKHRGLPGGS